MTPISIAFRLFALFIGAVASTGAAHAQSLKRTTLAVGTSVLNVSYPMVTLPLSLGYWREEGFEVDVQPVGASLQAVQQMVAGNADFAQVAAAAIIQSNVANNLPVRVVLANGVTDWSISVPTSSTIRTAADLKGKTIGVFTIATTGVPLLRSYLRSNGMDLEKDQLSLLPLGMGAPAVEALRAGKVDALLYWAGATASFRNAGLDIREIVPPEWRTYPDYSLATMQKTIDRDPAMVVAIARGSIKATIFAIENPECAVRLHWKKYPDTKPKGVDEATALRWDLNSIKAQLLTLADGFKLNGGKQWGFVEPGVFARLQGFLQDAGIIKGSVPAETLLAKIPHLYDRINDFDAAKIRAAAKACEVR